MEPSYIEGAIQPCLLINHIEKIAIIRLNNPKTTRRMPPRSHFNTVCLCQMRAHINMHFLFRRHFVQRDQQGPPVRKGNPVCRAIQAKLVRQECRAQQAPWVCRALELQGQSAREAKPVLPVRLAQLVLALRVPQGQPAHKAKPVPLARPVQLALAKQGQQVHRAKQAPQVKEGRMARRDAGAIRVQPARKVKEGPRDP